MSADDKDERQLLNDIQNQIQRAKRVSVRTSAIEAQRREILKRLIDLVHSPYSSLKSFAANNIKLFIKEFPELEDDAINAVYDLCEDQDPRVRKDGYRAITQVSRELKKLVKRNADVLVQLLQSDEPEEVEVVEQQLTEHLDMEPQITLGVLCDQIVPLEDYADEDQAVRDRLRSLVLGFMVGRAKRAIVERHADPAETVLVEGLFNGMVKLRTEDIDVLVKDILLSLPQFSRYSVPGDKLLQVILAGVTSTTVIEPRNVKVPAPNRTEYYLNLAAYVSIEKRIARPTVLLDFYVNTFASRIQLGLYPEDTRVFIIERFADALAASQEAAPKMTASAAEEAKRSRNSAVDACHIILSCILELEHAEKRPWRACKTFIQTCAKRKGDSVWLPPPQLVDVLERMHQEELSTSGPQEDENIVQDVRDRIRSLLGQSKLPSSTKTSRSPAPAAASGSNSTSKSAAPTKTNGGAVQINRRQRHDANLPRRPPPAQAPSNVAHQRDGIRSRGQTASTSGSSPRVTPSREPEPTAGKRKAGLGTEGSVPSLLSRMAITSGAGGVEVQQQQHPSLPPRPPPSLVPAKRRAESSGMQPKRANMQQARGGMEDAPGITGGELSIKGAVNAEQQSRAASHDEPVGLSIKGAASRAVPPATEGAGSLLDRIHHNNSASNGDSAARGKRKRTKT